MAGEGDLVLITGKAHEKSLRFGSKEEPWDEYKEVSDAISEKEKNAV